MPVWRRLSAAAICLAMSVSCLAEAPVASGSVTISYTFSRLFRIASNQYAIWIEDGTGAFVRTLFATGFAARRAGWRFRPQTLPTWVRAAGVRDLPQADVEAVSGATPRCGSFSVVWDLCDAKGRPVPPGLYRYVVEANICWEKEVLWAGTLSVGGQADFSRATALHAPAGVEASPLVISGVSARYTPAR